jgi:Ca2+-binding EF-hand superfamily protein
MPAGVSPQVGSLMQQGSQIFRSVDTNFSGQLNKREFKRAMQGLGIAFGKHEAKELFYRVDTNRSGHIDEREFVELEDKSVDGGQLQWARAMSEE